MALQENEISWNQLEAKRLYQYILNVGWPSTHDRKSGFC